MSAHSIIFDWNGTLFDDFEAMLECNNIVFTRFGRPYVTADAYREFYEVPFGALLRNHGFSPEEVSAMDDASKEIFHEHYEPKALKHGLRAGGEDILREVNGQGIKPVILSNHLVGTIRHQLQRLEIEHLFAEILAYADRATQFRDGTKGDKLRTYMKNKNLPPQKAIIIGDSVEEIEIAHQQGLVSVAITGGCVSETRLRAARPDHVIHSLHELKPILQERGFVS